MGDIEISRWVIRAAIIAATITRFQDIKDSEGNYNHYDAKRRVQCRRALRSYKISVTSWTTWCDLRRGPAFLSLSLYIQQTPPALVIALHLESRF